MPRARVLRARACLLRCVSLALTATTAVLAQTDVDADLVQRATVGPPAAIAPTSASAVTRARQANFEFPPSMQVLWRARVTGPVTLEPVVDERGRIALLHERGSFSMLSSTGTSAWSVRLGDAAPGASPALLSDGTLAVYNFDDRLLRLDADGNLLSSTQLGLKGRPSALLPLERGGVALAVDQSLVQLDQRGEVVAHAEAEHPIVELLQSRSGVLAVDRQGNIQRFHATGQLSPQGSFGRGVIAVALSGQTLFAVTGGQHLMSFQLGTQTARTIFSAAPSKTLQPWLALGPKTIYLAASDGTLRGLSHTGRARMRLGLGDGDPNRPMAALLPSATTPALADAGARVMLAGAGSETIVVDADGSHHPIASSACLSPTSLTPMPKQRVLMTCRNGELLALAAARTPPETPAPPTPAPAPTPSTTPAPTPTPSAPTPSAPTPPP